MLVYFWDNSTGASAPYLGKTFKTTKSATTFYKKRLARLERAVYEKQKTLVLDCGKKINAKQELALMSGLCLLY